MILCAGLGLLSMWACGSIAVGFAPRFISLAIFRALQGIDTAMTVPSAVGFISNYIRCDREPDAGLEFASPGALGFCLGRVSGAFPPRLWDGGASSGRL